MKSLREKHNMRCRKENRPALVIGDAVIMKGKGEKQEFMEMEDCYQTLQRKG